LDTDRNEVSRGRFAGTVARAAAVRFVTTSNANAFSRLPRQQHRNIVLTAAARRMIPSPVTVPEIANNILRKRTLAAIVFITLCIPSVQAKPQAPARTVLDGVYPDGQAMRGKVLYTSTCGGCHGDALEGVSAPELTGDRFIECWREAMLDVIYDFIRERMPPPPRRGRRPDTGW
jgi:mono/diheme cytochrome c family protein